ncbi:MAG: branched-chain amino acid ABC transporter permease [Planctomycetota bacterium]
MGATRRTWPGDLAIFAILALLPLVDRGANVYAEMPKIYIFSILALGLNLVVGNTGILHLGMAAFFAIGAYTAGILTCTSFPFHLEFGFWGALLLAPLAAAAAGFLLGLPVLRLRGDYVAIVTLGFGEIIQSVLKNLGSITKSAQGIAVPPPSLFRLSFESSQDALPWYGFSLGILAIAFWANRRLEAGSLGRAWRALREDELAAASCGIPTVRAKLAAFSLGAAYAGLAGALYASLLGTTTVPSSYNFMVSAMVVVMVILGGMGNLRGVLAGVILLQGFDMVVAPRLAHFFSAPGGSVGFFTDYTNWRWLAFGILLILLIRFRPQGLFPARRAGEGDA